MLHKSFKPAKCKTSLKLAASRIKLLKNKKEVQVRQLKGELAKLLESGQVQTARIRVEHFVREEKSKEAYELIEIFCELIAARLPMIESQKNCPIDLKEAVSSVIFASPRCADIPELMDVRKHFKAKYGKEFVSAAVDLRPECGVNRMLVEKLSAKAPDGQNKLRILTAIAEEHSIKWDPKSFSDSSSNPAADLLNGPNTFEKAGKISIQMEPIGVQPSTDHHNKGSPSVPVAFTSDERHNIPENSPQQNFRSTLHSQKSDSTDVNVNRINVTGHHISETRSSEINEMGTRYRHSSSGDQNNYSSDRQHWTMDFKDATSAAQAAAESAERASLAARAAAELSSREIISRQSSSEWQKSSPKSSPSNLGTISRQSSSERQKSSPKPSPSNLGTISRQSSSERQKSSPSNLKAEGPQEYASSNLQPQFRKDPVANASHRSSMMDDNWINNDAKSFVGSKAEESCEPSLVKSSPSNIDTNTYETNFDAEDAYSRKNSSYSKFNDYLGSGSTEEQPRNSDVQYVSDQPHGTSSRKISSPREARLGNDLNRAPSHEMLENDTDVNPFAMGKTNDYGNTVETSFNEASVVFDDYGLDDDFEIGHNYLRKESILDLSSPGGKMPINLSEATDTWIPKQDKYESPDKSVSHEQISEEPTPLFAENLRSSRDAFKSDDFLPATYDHSDGPSSESEEEAESAGKKNNGEFSNEQNLYSEKTEWTHNNSHGLAGFSYEEKRGTTTSCSSSKLSPAREAKGKASPPSSPDIIQDTLIFEESTSEGYSALSFGKLKGGLRNQKSPRRPYANNSSGSYLPSLQAGENYASKTENSTTISSTGRGSFRSNASSHETFHVEEKPRDEKGSQAKSNSYSYLDDSKDKFSDYTRRSEQELYSDEVGSKISKKSTSRVADQYPGLHGDDDTEEDLPRQNMNDSPRRATVLSRRTKTSPKSSNSYLKDSIETRTTHDDGSERKASRNYHASTVSLKMKTQTNYSNHLADPEQPQSSIPFKKTPETKRSYNEERLRSSTKEQSSNAPLELDTQGSYESLKISFSREKTAAPLKTKAQINNSDQIVNNEQPRSNKSSKQIVEPKRSYREERSTSSSVEVPSTSPKLETQGNSESLKREKSKAAEKASHVHPNLPDSDDFMAHFLSLRQNRK